MPEKGYIAITSAIIISVLLMVITFSISTSGFFSRTNILDAGFKEQGLALAEACADTALLKLAKNINYSGNENVSIGSDTCSILPIETASNQKIIKTRATFQNTVTNLKVVTQISDFSIVSWQEVPKF